MTHHNLEKPLKVFKLNGFRKLSEGQKYVAEAPRSAGKILPKYIIR
jgi:hypothetical protein